MTEPNSTNVPAKPSHKLKGHSRRRFLSGAAAVGAAAAFGASVGSPRGQGAPFLFDGPQIGSVRWRIDVERIEETFGDGSSVPFFRFVSRSATPTNGRLPILRARAGQLVGIRFQNNVGFPVQPLILDHQTGPVVMPGEHKNWYFNMPPAGTWMMTDAILGTVAGSAGFAACVVSNGPANGIQVANAPKIDREYFLMYQDTDDRWNHAIDVGDEPDENVYEPNYHTLNGLTFPNTMMDADTRINCALGDHVLIRIANLGLQRQSLHFHGYHARFMRRNNQVENMLPEKDTFGIPGYSTAEILLPVRQMGKFPMHPHSLTAVTDNGLYPGGQITLIDAAP